MDGLLTILQLIGALTVLIFIHELGHFVVARILKVEIEEFGLGFPPRLLTLFEAGGTKYTLNILPLGGFVRPKGENDPSVEGGLAAASPWVRLAVLLAGPVMNLLTGVILYTFIFSKVGMPDTSRVVILDIAPNSPAEQAGLLVGDMIEKVNEQVIDETTKLHEVIYANLGKEIDLVYNRGEMVEEVSLVPRENPPEGEGAIGILMGNPTNPINWYEALPMGAVVTYEHGLAFLTLPAKVIQGTIAPELARPVGYKGIYDIYQEVKGREPIPGTPTGLNVIGFFTSITISLAMLNLLPIPALDGGRILFTLPEILFRRRIPSEIENWINLISFSALILVFLYINLLDFTNPIQFP